MRPPAPSPEASPGSPPRRGRPRAGRTGPALVAPAAVWLAIFVVVPAALVVVLAFLSFDPLTGAVTPAGLGNFRRVLADADLPSATLHTLAYAALTVVPIMLIGLLIALAIHSLSAGADIWRSAYFLPVASTLAGMSVVWRWMFYPGTGIVDSSLGRLLGVHDWLNSTALALPAVALVGCWQGIGSTMVMFLAGLSGIPQVLREAATLDGAGRWHRFWAVTWPALGPATVFALITTTRDSLRVYDQVAVMTQGGPYDASNTLAYLMWQRGVAYADPSGASVVNLALLALVLATIVAQLWVVGRRWEATGTR